MDHNENNARGERSQDGKQNADRDKRQGGDSKHEPLPGSIAADNQAAAAKDGSQSNGDESDAPAQDYNGPGVLSRSYSVIRPLTPEDTRFRETLGVSAIFDTGLTPFTVGTTSNSVATGNNIYGTAVNWGISGRHLWRRDQLGIVFNGNYQQYFPSSLYNGSNNQLSLDYTHILSRRFSFTVVAAGSIYSQNYPLEDSQAGLETSVADINLASSPSIQIFDTTTKQFSLQTNLTWRKTDRLSFSIGGNYFVIVRDAPGLLGVGGEQAVADVAYRLSRKTTVGAYYAYSYYKFPQGFGTTDVNTAGLIYSYAFNSTFQFRLRGGFSRVESLGLAAVAVNPVIAFLTGQSTEIEDSYQKTYVSDISAQLVKDFRHGRTASVAYARGVSPGNGLFQTSEQESITGSISTRLFRNYVVNLTAGRNTLSSVSQTIGKFIGESGTFSASRLYSHNLSLNFMVSYRYFNVVDELPIRNEVRVSMGVIWNPSARVWPL